MSVKEFKIPAYGEDPSEELIEFLNECTQYWEGDDSGIVIGEPSHDDDGHCDTVGEPGVDYVVCGEDGVYRIIRGADIEAWRLANK